MKQTYLLKTALAGLALLFMTSNSCLALSISGRITNAKSSYIHFCSCWDRRDSFQLDEKGYFSATLNLAQYEEVKDKIVLFSLSTEEYFSDWQGYARKNPLPWQQGFWVSDESMDRNGLRENYHLNAVPLDILIDQNRKIISFNPSIDEVLAFLNKK